LSDGQDPPQLVNGLLPQVISLADKAFEIRDLSESDSHLLHSVNDWRCGESIDERLLKLFEALRESLLCLLRRVL
jgi:hypothetical protein